MLRGFYSVASALEAATRNQELVAENLAHVSTPGYRRQGLVFEVLGERAAPAADPMIPANVAAQQSFTRLDSGALEQTNNPLDVALTGDAFFVLDGPNGTVYTRNGGFELSPSGQLQTRGGLYRVRGQGGALTLPTNGGPITIGRDGTISVNGIEAGRLELARFSNPQSLRRVGPTLFEGDGAQPPLPGAVTVEQGYREGSNVQAVQEMVSMMLGMRFYEAAERAMRALSDAVAQNTNTQA